MEQVKLILLIMAVVFFACTTSKKSASFNSTDLQEGLEIITSSDCFTCHKLSDSSMVGPSYYQIADRYELNEKNISQLSKKIRKGGRGAWREIPMLPHTNMSDNAARKAVKYILTIKNK